MKPPYLLFFCLLTHGAAAAVTGGTVETIRDGDSFILRIDPGTDHSRTETVQLKAIDAPEPGQPFAAEAKAALEQRLIGRAVTVDWSRRDARHALIGRVTIDAEDLGLLQLRAGFAWYQRGAAGELSLPDQGYYLSEESAARRNKAGLWSDKNPVAPWVYRAANRKSGSRGHEHANPQKP